MLSFVADYTVFIWVTSIIVASIFYHAAKVVRGLSILAVVVCVCVFVINGLTVWIAIVIEQRSNVYMYCRLLAYVMRTVPIQFIVGVTTKPNLLAVLSGVLLIASIIAYVWMGTDILGIHPGGTFTTGELYVCTSVVLVDVGHTILIVLGVLWYMPIMMWNRPSMCLLGGVVSFHLACALFLSINISTQWTGAHVLFVYLELVVSCRIFLKLSKNINRDSHCVKCDICQSLTCQACPVCTTYSDIYRLYVRSPLLHNPCSTLN
jgi:hypothetical protein